MGGLPLKKFYPELGNAALWCCTEMTTRTAIDTAVGMLAESEAEEPHGERAVEEVAAMKHPTRKATRHVNQNEGLIFEKSSPGKAAFELPPLDVPAVDTAKRWARRARRPAARCPKSAKSKSFATSPAFHLELRH